MAGFPLSSQDHPESLRMLKHLFYANCWQYYDQLLSNSPRYTDERCLTKHGHRVYSQNDEDGLIEEIFNRIGIANRSFVECGVGDGLENNTLYWLMQGWRGVWIDADDAHVETAESHLSAHLELGILKAQQAFITAENIEDLFEELDVQHEIDLLSIDIDGNDYWMWKAITNYSPRVVVIEYNSGFGPKATWKQRYQPNNVWQGTRNHGASLKALEQLGSDKGYCLVGCNLKGMNAFFVRNDLVQDQFLAPYDSETHYESPKFHLWHSIGHKKDPAELDSFEVPQWALQQV